MHVSFRGVTVEIAGWRACDDVTIDVATGSMTVLVGANGAGKSTLLRCLYRALRPTGGVAEVAGDDVWRLAGRDAGQRIAAVVQEPSAGFDMTVEELVALGRIPHHRGWQRLEGSDWDLVAESLERVGMAGFGSRQVATLSGGERQRMMIARALAQQAKVLVLDEPTNHLDIRHQLEVLELVRTLDVTVVSALHDLGLAERYADQVVLLARGAVVGAGEPRSTITIDAVRTVFGVEVRFLDDPHTGRRSMVFGLPPTLEHGR
ncbi:MAG: ABC transporter ATP-binding protein [Desertimonas sp.]